MPHQVCRHSCADRSMQAAPLASLRPDPSGVLVQLNPDPDIGTRIPSVGLRLRYQDASSSAQL